MLGDKIRAARKNAKMTQEDLAKEIGVQRSVISKYESDIIDPTIAQLQKIAEALGVLLVDLLDDNSSKVYNAGFIDGAVAEWAENNSILGSQLADAFSRLNPKGQQVAVERVEELTKIPDYRKAEDK